MDRGDLERSWAVTGRHLRAASQILSSFELVDDHLPQFRAAQEFLDHNELELAIDCVAEAAEGLKVPRQFWLELRDAASNMGLSSRAEEFETRPAHEKS